jgi:adenylosuccinate lyase
MPHKRNPERSEHLDTLARLTRAHAGVMLEAMVQLHERDGRGWKAEWPTFPELCLLTSTSLELALDLVRTLEVDADRMRTNVVGNDLLLSEQVLGAYAARVGKHQAQAELQSLLAGARADGRSLAEAVITAGVVDASDVATLSARTTVPTAEHAVDIVTARVARQLDTLSETWP